MSKLRAQPFVDPRRVIEAGQPVGADPYRYLPEVDNGQTLAVIALDCGQQVWALTIPDSDWRDYAHSVWIGLAPPRSRPLGLYSVSTGALEEHGEEYPVRQPIKIAGGDTADRKLARLLLENLRDPQHPKFWTFPEQLLGRTTQHGNRGQLPTGAISR